VIDHSFELGGDLWSFFRVLFDEPKRHPQTIDRRVLFVQDELCELCATVVHDTTTLA
jgi:hypothetical protein